MYRNIAIVVMLLNMVGVTWLITATHYKTKYNLAIANHNTEILKLNDDHARKIKKLELTYTERINKLSTDYETEIESLKNIHVYNVSNNDYRLLDKSNILVTPKFCDVATNTCTFKLTESGIRLSKEATNFLLNLSHEADQDRAKLNLCKNTLREYHSIVDEYNKTLNTSTNTLNKKL